MTGSVKFQQLLKHILTVFSSLWGACSMIAGYATLVLSPNSVATTTSMSNHMYYTPSSGGGVGRPPGLPSAPAILRMRLALVVQKVTLAP